MFLLGVAMMITSCFAQEILQNPDNTTVFLDNDVIFSCVTNGGVSSWKVNGTYFEELSIELRRDLVIGNVPSTDGNTHLTLTIPAKAQYNGTRVQCVSAASDGSTSVDSQNASLFIQGMLSSVSSLETTFNSTSVTVTWDAPFTLDVSGVDPDIWYSVIIYNVTDIDNPFLINCSDCTNIPYTHYVFRESLKPCHMYNFSVIPFNEVGAGEIDYNVTLFIQFTMAESIDSNSLKLNEVVLFNRGEQSFIVLESVETETTLFYSQPLISDRCTSTDIVLQNVPPATYNIFFYFVTQEATSYRNLYNIENESPVTGKDDTSIRVISDVLSDAMIKHINEERVDIYCFFKDQGTESSCVVVYREYGNEILFVKEHPQTTEFPVSLTVNYQNSPTIAIFGKRAGVIDNEPIISIKEESSKQDEGNHVPVTAVAIPIVVFGVLLCLIIVTAVIIFYQRKQESNQKSQTDETQEEIDVDSSPESYKSDEVNQNTNSQVEEFDKSEEVQKYPESNPQHSQIEKEINTIAASAVEGASISLEEGPLQLRTTEEEIEHNFKMKHSNSIECIHDK